MTAPDLCEDEARLAGCLARSILGTLALALTVSLVALLVSGWAGCAPSLKCASVSVDPAGLSLEEQREAVAFVASGISSTDLRGWRIYVEPYPIHFDPPLVTGFGRVSSATSVTWLGSQEIVLTWTRRPDGSLDVEDLPYEIQNVRCQCESALSRNP